MKGFVKSGQRQIPFRQQFHEKIKNHLKFAPFLYKTDDFAGFFAIFWIEEEVQFLKFPLISVCDERFGDFNGIWNLPSLTLNSSAFRNVIKIKYFSVINSTYTSNSNKNIQLYFFLHFLKNSKEVTTKFQWSVEELFVSVTALFVSSVKKFNKARGCGIDVRRKKKSASLTSGFRGRPR